jgi:hypothetical protein
MSWLAKTLPQAETLELPICYRSSRAVVRYAQEFVPGIQPADGAEDGRVAEASLTQMFSHAEPKDFILSRSNAGAVSACLTLLAQGKAAKLRGRPKFGLDLANLVQNSKCTYCEQFRVFINDWKSREIARCVKEEKDPQLVTDKADCLMLLSEGLETVQELIDKIAILFREDAPGVTCSTIHGAKGMETDRVWLLGQSFKGCHYYAAKGLRESPDTMAHHFSCKRAREENNITYVAITRAKRELYCVDGIPRRLG